MMIASYGDVLMAASSDRRFPTDARKAADLAASADMRRWRDG
jgi:hypothetical protein